MPEFPADGAGLGEGQLGGAELAHDQLHVAEVQQRGCLALAVAELAVDAQRFREMLPGLGDRAGLPADAAQLVQRGGLAVQVSSSW